MGNNDQEIGMLAVLEQDLEQRDFVILIDKKYSEYLTELLCTSTALKKTKKQLSILSTTEFPGQMGKHLYRKISEEEMDLLLQLYRTYEVSDRILLFSVDPNYGSMWNYVKSGIASQEEILQAMLL